jgi:SAM-dependent methyltransferase
MHGHVPWPAIVDATERHEPDPEHQPSRACAPYRIDALALRTNDRILDVSHWGGDEPARLPFADDSFDVVVCHQGLQLFADRGRALSEMRRVLARCGRLVVSVWGPIERNPALAVLAGALERHAGMQVAAAVHWLCSLTGPEDLRAVLACADFRRIRVRTIRRTIRIATVSELLDRLLAGSPAEAAIAHVCEDQRRKVIADLEVALGGWTNARGLRIGTETNTAVAIR